MIPVILFQNLFIFFFSVSLFRRYNKKKRQFRLAFTETDISFYFSVFTGQSHFPRPHWLSNDVSCYIYTACRCMRKRMCHSTSISDHIQTFMAAFEILIDVYFHIIEFHFDTVQQQRSVSSTAVLYQQQAHQNCLHSRISTAAW